MQLTSCAFETGGEIPRRYTCQGEDINPPLEISNVPESAQSLVLIMEDPDVPLQVRKDRLWVHWLIYNMPPQTRRLAENHTPPGVEGKNTNGQLGYMGPCPPDRRHRYFFKLYALSTLLDLPPGATKDTVLKAIEGHILDEAHLMGTYEKT